MSLLTLEHVTRRYRHRAQERVVLRDVCLQVERGEMVAIWGARHSGRSTLLRVAAGVEPADGGAVRFAGADVRARGGELLGESIGYCQQEMRRAEPGGVLELLMIGQLARGVPARAARRRATEALERVAAGSCAPRELPDLDAAEAVRVSLARALTLQPSLLMIDEPVSGVDLLERDRILALLRSLADEGVAVLITAGEATALRGADRALALVDGELRGSVAPELAQVLPLRRRASL